MTFTTRVAFAISLIAFSNVALSAQPLDSRLVGKWQGERDKSAKCQFLAWNSEFKPDGRFEITFFENKERTVKINTERGVWKAADGKSELRTDGVPTPEIYVYTIVDPDTVKYVNTVKDPSADCQEDYEFTEHRTTGW